MATTAKTSKSKPDPKKKPHAVTIPVTLIRLDKIEPSPLNRDAGRDLAPLVDSIRAHGLQQPIKLRPKADGYEIVYGERRFRACKKLGHETIPSTVETLTDDEAQELRILENTQRQDPHALEEAEAYETLLTMKDAKAQPLHTPESVAKLAGRSVGHVYNRLKLTDLHPELRKALYKNEVTLTGAFLIARGIPTDLQPEAWKKMVEYARDEADVDEVDDDGRLTARGLQRIIDSDYASRLDKAPFGLKDAKLLPEAGSCQVCPKRSGNQPQLFTDADAKDVCTDLPCYQKKVSAYIAREKQRVLALGGQVLSEEESRRLFNGGSFLSHNSKWIDLDGVYYEAAERPTWRKFLGDLCPPPTLAFTAQNKPVLLAVKADVLAVLKANGLDPDSIRAKAAAAAARKATTGEKLAGERPAHHDDPDDEDLSDVEEDPDSLEEELDHHRDTRLGGATAPPQDEKLQIEIRRLARHRIVAAIIAAAEKAPPDDNRFVQVVYETMLHGGYSNAVSDAAKRRVPKRPKGEHATATLQTHVLGMTSPQQLRALILELAIQRSACYSAAGAAYSHDITKAIELYAIDTKSIEASIADELSAKRGARPAAAKTGSA